MTAFTKEVADSLISDVIERHKNDLKGLSEQIHANPELNFEEYKAHDTNVALLEKLGFKVTPHAYGIATAFEAEVGIGGRLVVFNAEYDALPDIGHACGHNLIDATSFGGFLAVAELLAQTKVPGRVRLLGTPAEEGGGGKVVLLNKGAYKGVDACLMAHPAPLDQPFLEGTKSNGYAPHVAINIFEITFEGSTAHAAAAPWEGINALDAVVLGYNGVSMLRQQMPPGQRVHGIITDGGKRSNIIPEIGCLDYAVRARTIADVRDLKKRVLDCFIGAAKATGCKIKITDGKTYSDMRPSKTLSHLYADEMAKFDYEVLCNTINQEPTLGATDQGNVSYVVPAIHPVYGIPAPPGAGNHTIGFTAAAATPEAFDTCLLNAKGLASCAWRMLIDDELAAKVKKEFDDNRAARVASGEAKDEEQMVYAMAEGKTMLRGSCTCGHN